MKMLPLIALLMCVPAFGQNVPLSCTLDPATLSCSVVLTLTATLPAPPPVSISITPASDQLQVGQAQQFTAGLLNASDAGVSWSVTGSIGTVDQTGLFTATSLGTGTITVTSTQDPTKSASAALTTVPGFDGPAELPRAYLNTSLSNTPAPGAKTNVPAGASLQAALNAANCGDTLLLQAGATFSSVGFNIPAKPCDDQHWIIVRTSAPDSALPSEGVRLTPCYAGVASLPGRPPFNCVSTANVVAKIVDPQGNNGGPLFFADGANHYRFIGVEVTRAGTGINFQLISSLATVHPADKIIFDRVWLHGDATNDNKNAFNLAGFTNTAFINSSAHDFHCEAISGACTDAKVIGGGNSTLPGGPYKIANDFLEASGENVIFGGGSATTTPADIEIRRNHFFKPLIWLLGQPGYTPGVGGHSFIVKNLLELKNAQRVLVEGNIFENNWGGFSQAGYSLLLTPKNQAGGCPICTTSDVTVRYNTFSHSGSGISIANVPDDGGQLATSGLRYSLHDITVDDVNMTTYAGNGVALQLLSSFVIPLSDVQVDHVTIFSDPRSKIISTANVTTNAPMFGFTYTNSIVGQAQYPIWNAGGTTSCAVATNSPLAVLNACFPNGGYTWNNVAAIAVNLSNYPVKVWPAGTLFPASAAAVGFTNFNNGVGGDYRLLSSSPYKSASTDGKDLGADIDAINKAIANVY